MGNLTLMERVALLENRLNHVENQASDYWILATSYSIWFMQLGFLLLEAGSVMSKNTKSIMLKNLLDTFAGGLVWSFLDFIYSSTLVYQMHLQ